jgi:hypothetical protein
MAIARQYVTSVGTSATPIDGTQYPGWLIQNVGSANVFLGDGAVTTGTGWILAAGDIFSPSELSHKSLTGRSDDRLSGIVATGTVEVRVFIPGRINP